MSHIYPPGPIDVPPNFTRLTPGYRLQVALVLISLLFSLALYLGLLVGSALLCRWLVTAPWPARMDRGYGFLRIAAIICSALLFLYLLKGLFKRSRQDLSLLEEIKEAEQPELFAFIRRICADTGAPFPKHVYITPEVNAAVFYQSSFLNLFLPTRKNLLIGLGLVNNLNISEFKAVLAHEFGHFSQKSMKLGTYVYVINKVLGDIIYGRDFLDDLVHQAKGLDLRIAVFAWVFLGILWGLRKGLEGLFKVINIFNLSLMREMEFNADRMAVSVAGSDAMVHALLKSGFADQAFRQMSGDLWSAADHQLYSRDIFHHQQPAGDLLRRRAKNLRLGLPPQKGGPQVQVFAAGEDDVGIPLMWQTHPSNHDREKSAKMVYVPVEVDERPASLLFQNEADLRFRVSQKYYQVLHKPEQEPRYSEAYVVQRFLDEEYAETTFSERYQGFYDNRYLEITDLRKSQNLALQESRAGTSPHELADEIDSLFGPALQTWVEDHQKRLGDFDLLAGLHHGQFTLKEKALKFRGQAHAPSDVPMLLESVEKELEEDRRTKAGLDERVFRLHWRLARLVGPGEENSLTVRYQFHLAVQSLHQQIVQGQGDAQTALTFAGSRRQLTQEEFSGVRDLLQQATRKLFDTLRAAEPLSIPALRNIPAATPLRDFLLQKEPVEHLSMMENIEPEWITRFMAQLLEVQDKLKRLLFKSMGGILAAQEQITQMGRIAATPVVS